jgi:DNA replication and repair protein RecF
MLVKRVMLRNFRNYENSTVDLCPQRNIILGANAQGKSNLLEAIELLANGYSDRAGHDLELIQDVSRTMHVELICHSGGVDHTLAMSLTRIIGTHSSAKGRQVEKKIAVNGISSSLTKKLRGRLVTVSFKSEDLNLLRGSPKFRRDWLDRIILNCQHSYQEILSKYLKVITQRNRLLKLLSQKVSVNSSDRDELKIWDEQTAQYGAKIVKCRLQVLGQLLPTASIYQGFISEDSERLSITYNFKNAITQEMTEDDPADDSPLGNVIGASLIEISSEPGSSFQAKDRENISESEIVSAILNSLQKRRFEEIARGQTLFGPHRDDILFLLNGMDATAFASQGQQRSLVLALKLAELKLISERLEEPPVLLLDDVLAELDLKRQGLLMSLVQDDMQTIISTTHLNNFHDKWLSNALFIEVVAGGIIPGERQAEMTK